MNIHPVLLKSMVVLALVGLVLVAYLASALIFLGAIILILLNPLTWQRLLGGLAAGAAWLFIWYAPKSIRIGAFLELLVLWVFHHIYLNRHEHKEYTGRLELDPQLLAGLPENIHREREP